MATIDPKTINVHNNEEAGRFEAEVAGETAFAAYRRRGATITFTHTEVPPEIGHHGVGGRIAQVALDSAREQGLTVIPRCPFIAAYIKEHPKYQDLV